MTIDEGSRPSPEEIERRDTANFIRGLSESLRDRGLGMVDVNRELKDVQPLSSWEPSKGTLSAEVAEFVREHIKNNNGDAPSAVEPFIELARSKDSLIELSKISRFQESVTEAFTLARPDRPFGPDQFQELEIVVTEMVESGQIKRNLSNIDSSENISSAARLVGHYDDRMFAKAQAARADGLPVRETVQSKQPEITATPEQEQEQDRGPESGRGR